MDRRRNRAEKLFMEADQLIKDKKIPEALDVLHECIEIYPDFGKAYNHLGWIHDVKLGNVQEADTNYQLALKYSPEYRAVYYNYAVILSVSKRYRELDELLQKASTVAGINMGTIYNEYAIMHESQQYYEQAIEYYQKYIGELFNDNNINNAMAAIERCRRKMNIMR
ncbi:MAG: hypothetical protein GY810_21005 [Aureispira sp.]|nr:hypothetical protein [Aureispira sp.]